MDGVGIGVPYLGIEGNGVAPALLKYSGTGVGVGCKEASPLKAINPLVPERL